MSAIEEIGQPLDWLTADDKEQTPQKDTNGIDQLDAKSTPVSESQSKPKVLDKEEGELSDGSKKNKKKKKKKEKKSKNKKDKKNKKKNDSDDSKSSDDEDKQKDRSKSPEKVVTSVPRSVSRSKSRSRSRSYVRSRSRSRSYSRSRSRDRNHYDDHRHSRPYRRYENRGYQGRRPYYNNRYPNNRRRFNYRGYRGNTRYYPNQGPQRFDIYTFSRSRSKSYERKKRKSSRSRSLSRSRSYERKYSRSHSRSSSIDVKKIIGKNRSRSKSKGSEKFSFLKARSSSLESVKIEAVIKKGKKKKKKRSRSKSTSSPPAKKIKEDSSGSESDTKKKKKKKKKEKKKDKQKEKESSLHNKLMARCKFLEDLQGLIEPERAYYTDSKGDGTLKISDSTNFAQLSKFSVKTKGYPLGTTDRDIMNSKKENLRYFKKSGRELLSGSAVVVSSVIKSDKQDLPYIPINLPYSEAVKKNKVMSIDSLQRDNKDGPVSSQQIELEYWNNLAKSYNQSIASNPSDISLWLKFIKFQDKAFMHMFQNLTKDKSEKKAKKNSIALAERKMAIIDAAIKKNPRSLLLQYEKVEIGQDIWTDKQLKQEWSKILFNFPNSVEVWHNYLNFMVTHFATYKLSTVVDSFKRCKEKLQEMQNGNFVTHCSTERIDQCLVDVASQLACIWRQAGHLERSIGLFQALVEFNLFAPGRKRAKYSHAEKLVLFESFWDSRSPRFGEKGSVGWSTVLLKREKIEYPDIILGGTVDEEDKIIEKGGTVAEMWLQIESSREHRHWLPFEQDPDDCEDPERMVNLEDIAPHLFVIESDLAKFYLVLKFLKFLNVPIDLNNEMMNVSNKVFNDITEIDSDGSYIYNSVGLETLADPGILGNEILSGNQFDLFKFPRIGPTAFNLADEEYFNFICRIIRRCVTLFTGNIQKSFAILFIKVVISWIHSMDSVKEPNEQHENAKKELKKEVKNILKRDEFRNCLELYYYYAELERLLGHDAETTKVYSMALTLGTSDTEAFNLKNVDFKVIMNLYTAYIKFELEKEVESKNVKHSNNVLLILASLGIEEKLLDETEFSLGPGNILKAMKKIKVHLDNCLSDIKRCVVDERRAIFLCKLTFYYAILQLISAGFVHACEVYDLVIESISEYYSKNKDADGKPLAESKAFQQKYVLSILYEDYIWMMNTSPNLARQKRELPLSPTRVKEIVTQAVKVDPKNHIFLIKLFENQASYGLLKGLPESEEPCIYYTIFQLLPHIKKVVQMVKSCKEGSFSYGFQLESLLEKAVSENPGKHCPLLWRLYLTLISFIKPKTLQALTYRAILNCPGVKSVYLDSVRLVPTMLPEVVKLLSEKEIRIRLPLEELHVLTEKEEELIAKLPEPVKVEDHEGKKKEKKHKERVKTPTKELSPSPAEKTNGKAKVESEDSDSSSSSISSDSEDSSSDSDSSISSSSSSDSD